MLDFFASWLTATWSIVFSSAPYLLLGFFVAGLISQFLPLTLIEKRLAQPGATSVFWATVFGLPLPLCSCSVIPVGTALRQKGASRGATAAFLISTPEIGVDSFILSLGLLGLPLTLIRVVAAFCTAFVVGFFIDKTSEANVTRSGPGVDADPACCEGHLGKSKLKVLEQPLLVQAISANFSSRLFSAFRYGFIDLPKDLFKVLAVGFVLAGLFSVLVPDDFFLGFSNVLAVLLMLALSFPLYVCATSATPLAAVLLAKGLPPAAVIVFLLAGPASNITTMGAVRKFLGKKALLLYLIGVSTMTLITASIVGSFFDLKIPHLLSTDREIHHH
ncbi:SO_0444 family Cu/Zn efflux transporter [bacterium]|nr:SO_0444 family Cu/Zn efflux transporter [bacterium]